MPASLLVPTWALAVGGAALAVTASLLAAAWRQRARRLHDSRHEAERLRALAKERAERVSVLSHEIRTPLSLAKGAGELLAEETPGPLNPRQRQFIRTITENVQQTIDMAEGLLTEARLEATLFDVQLATTDLRVLVRQTVRELRRVHDKPIMLDSRGAPLMVPVDRGLMRQAIWNLVNNSARHAGEGVRITVRLTGGDDAVLLAVTDNGAGMTARERADLFTPFATGSTRRPGTGLGMMITQRIVELHGGRVFVDTVARRGTTIFLSLPGAVS